MRRRIEALADQLEEFVSEDGHDALVIRCPPEAVGLVGAAIDLNEQRGSIDVSIPFFEVFRDLALASDALRVVVDAFRDGHALPAGEPAGARAPHERLVEALVHFAGAIRQKGDVRVAVWLCPTSVEDEAGYFTLSRALVEAARRATPPLRVALRDPDGALRAWLRSSAIPTLDVAVEHSPRALREGLAEDALAAGGDVAARAAAALAVAMADAAEGRSSDALAGLATLADFHGGRGESATQGLCFVLAGVLVGRRGDVSEGRAHVARALGLAMRSHSPMLALNAALSGGELALLDRDWLEADAHFDLAARLAAHLGQRAAIAQALLRRAEALRVLEGEARALQAFACAAAAARAAGASELERDALEHAAAIYRAAGLRTHAATIDARASSCGRGADHTHPSPTP